MPGFHAYIIGQDGHFHAAVPLDCADDTEAMDQTEQLIDGHDVELWQRDRKIAGFDHMRKIQF